MPRIVLLRRFTELCSSKATRLFSICVCVCVFVNVCNLLMRGTLIKEDQNPFQVRKTEER